MDERRKLKIGIIGLLATAFGSFVPSIVALFGVVSVLTWLDFVLLPFFLIFAGMTGHAVWKIRQARAQTASPPDGSA